MSTPTHYGLTWREVCEDPNLRDLPYKIELNEWGQVVMSPARLKHGAYQFQIGQCLSSLPETRTGQVITECAIQTSKGTKVPDVAWFSPLLWAQVADAYDSPVAPEICVEVLSPGNAPAEIEQKQALYFEAGAHEVWLCGVDGQMQFFDADGPLKHSKRVPSFPTRITL